MRALVGVLLSATVVGSAAARPAPFIVGGENFTAEVPAGECLPSGKLKSLADQAAAANPSALTDLTFYNCSFPDVPAGQTRYELIQTPRDSLKRQAPSRWLYLAQLRVQSALGGVQREISEAKPDRYASAVVRRATGRAVQLSSSPRLVEIDGNAAYFAALVRNLSDPSKPPEVVVAALTTIKGRAIGWALYSHYLSDAATSAQLAAVKARIARLIAANAG